MPLPSPKLGLDTGHICTAGRRCVLKKEFLTVPISGGTQPTPLARLHNSCVLQACETKFCHPERELGPCYHSCRGL